MTEHDEHHHTLSYADAIEQFRADKDAYFRSGAGSPVPAAERAAFAGLPYFPVDEAYIVDGLALLPYEGDEPVRFEIPTTDGRLRPAERAGVFRFELGGAERTLTAYRLAGAGGEVGTSRCSSRSSTRRAGPRRTAPAATSTSSPRTTGPGRSTSTSPTTRRACTTRGSPAR